jgi:hypothetical protein
MDGPGRRQAGLKTPILQGVYSAVAQGTNSAGSWMTQGGGVSSRVPSLLNLESTGEQAKIVEP